MLQKRADRLAPKLVAISSKVTFAVRVQPVDKGATNAKMLAHCCCLHPAFKGTSPEPGLNGEQISQAAWFSEAILKLLQFWGGDTSVRNPN